MISSPSLEHLALDARAVHEHAVQAAVVEHAHAVGLAHDQRVPARDGGVVEAHVGGEAAPDAGPLARQRHGPQLAVLLVAEVLAGLLDPLADRRRAARRGRRDAARTSVRALACAASVAGRRSVLNSDARTKSSPAALGQSVSASEPVSVST